MIYREPEIHWNTLPKWEGCQFRQHGEKEVTLSVKITQDGKYTDVALVAALANVIANIGPHITDHEVACAVQWLANKYRA